MKTEFIRVPWQSALLTVLFSTAAADDETVEDRVHGPDHEHDALEEVRVTATATPRDALELSQSATVLQGEALAREAHNNIGDTLARLPGLSNASFGQNIGRPVIRGLQGGRVGVLNDGMTSFDASAISQDHAVPTEPFLADQVEVLRGPTTLLYGSGAIGGVVNMVTHTIPEDVPQAPFEGRALFQGDSAADQRFGAARLDAGSGRFAFHVNGFVRRTDDYEIPDGAELYPDEDHDEHAGDDGLDGGATSATLENSFLDNEGGAVGGAWIGDRWRFGLAWTDYESDYGIPGAHAHHHEDDEGFEEHEPDGGEEEDHVTIRLDSRRADAVASAMDPFPGFSALELKVADTRYTHTEFEGREVGTVFDSATTDARIELAHSPWDRWKGTFGGQWSDNDFSAVGEEAFVPPSHTRSGAVFWVESADYDAWTFDFGLRYEDTSIDSFLAEHEHEPGNGEAEHVEEEAPKAAHRDFQPFSASAGAVWHLDETSHLAFTLARAQRAPSSGELFSNGPHVATQSFEVGDPDLGVETNVHYELSWRVHEGPVTGSLTVYHDDFDDYIFQAGTGGEEDGLPERLWSQQDAVFTGGEVEIRWDMGENAAGHWQWFGVYDRVRASLADGDPVPRIPPRRIGLGLDWDRAAWTGHLAWIHASAHTRTAPGETVTPGYDLVNAELSVALPFGRRTETVLFLKGRNLLDEDIRNSTSFLKDQAPQIGRNVVLGAKLAF